MKFKPWKKLSYRQKQPTSEAQYNYIKTVGQFSSLAPFKSLPNKMKTTIIGMVNKELHNYIASTLSSLDVPFYNELTYKQKYNKRAYYECMVDALTGAGEVFKITGTITDGTNAIANAVCTIDDETVLTGEDGKYLFTDIMPGVYTLKVSAGHYSSKTSQITVNASDVTRNLSLELIEFTVSGVISDGEDPVTGAVVKLDDKEFTTESDGEYEFTFVSKGEHEIVVEAEGYDKEETSVTVNNADVTKDITLTATE